MASTAPGNRRRASASVTGRPGNRLPGGLDSTAQRASSIAAVRIENASDTSTLAATVAGVRSDLDAIDLAEPATLQTKLDDYEARIAALEAP